MINKLVLKFIGKDEKDKMVVKNVIITFLIRGFALALALVKMPMYISYFNDNEVLGIWFTILSILSWIFTFDLGIGNGLRNKLVKSIEEKNNNDTKKYISSAYISIFILIFFISIVIGLIIPKIDWNSFFNVTKDAISNSEFIKVMYVVLIGLLCQFFLKLVNSILYALQKSFYPNLFSFITELSLVIVIMFLDNDIAIEKKLYLIALLHSLCACIPLLVATVILFLGKLKKAKPNIKYFSKKYAKSILFVGGMFFWIQIMYMIIVNTNEYLITWFVGPKYVVDYQIYNKLYSLIGTLFTLMLTPMWSMVTKAVASNDYGWIRKLYNKLKKLTIFAISCEVLIIPFMQLLVNIWLSEKAIQVNYLYCILFTISGSLLIWNGVLSTIANGMEKLRVQFKMMTLGVMLNIPLAYLFCNILDSWIGVVIANIISFLPYCIIQPIYLNKYIKEGENIIKNLKEEKKS